MKRVEFCINEDHIYITNEESCPCCGESRYLENSTTPKSYFFVGSLETSIAQLLKDKELKQELLKNWRLIIESKYDIGKRSDLILAEFPKFREALILMV